MTPGLSHTLLGRSCWKTQRSGGNTKRILKVIQLVGAKFYSTGLVVAKACLFCSPLFCDVRNKATAKLYKFLELWSLLLEVSRRSLMHRCRAHVSTCGPVFMHQTGANPPETNQLRTAVSTHTCKETHIPKRCCSLSRSKGTAV